MEKKNLFSFLLALGLGYFIGKQGGVGPAMKAVKDTLMPAPTPTAELSSK